MAQSAARPAAPEPSVQTLLDAEVRPVPSVLRQVGTAAVPVGHIDRRRYFDPAFEGQEQERLWSRCWQMACREEDIPEAGDFILHDMGSSSLLVTRQADGGVLALVNACLHRGRRLRDCDGHAEHFRCPFHGFSWHLDGSCRSLVNGWDFAHVEQDAFRLPRAHVGRWGGFIFVNPAEDAEPFEQFLEFLPAHYATRGWDLSQRVKAVHVKKLHRCNWKVALEAFIESFHVTETHRGAGDYLGFLPLGDDPDQCSMEIMFLLPATAGRDMPVAREPQLIGFDVSHREAAQLGGFAAVFDEDMSNLAAIQKGLKSLRSPGPMTGAVQEARIRHFHRCLDTFMAAGG